MDAAEKAADDVLAGVYVPTLLAIIEIEDGWVSGDFEAAVDVASAFWDLVRGVRTRKAYRALLVKLFRETGTAEEPVRFLVSENLQVRLLQELVRAADEAGDAFDDGLELAEETGILAWEAR